jgi:hydrogenase maturation protein HypF
MTTVQPESVVRRHVVVEGTVQGVGFRPFVHRLATELRLAGWVLNQMGGVEIEVEGPSSALDAFLAALRRDAPPLARVESVQVADVEPVGVTDFEIRASRAVEGEAQPVPPDTAMCADCLRELLDPHDRRYRYPFINCTNCGPRFTIIESLPYDRPRTTMRWFQMCPACAHEYEDPADRRFHAQPVACPACGPTLTLEVAGRPFEGDPIAGAVALLRQGQIIAIKGLGGFHLACDARSNDAVARLRTRKHRGAKPFAVMFPDLDSLDLEAAETGLLQSPHRPIVLIRAPSSTVALSIRSDEGQTVREEPSGRLRMSGVGDPRTAEVDEAPRTIGVGAAQPSRAEAPFELAQAVAPGLREVGVMLPSTPLHFLLLQEFGGPLVMTSGNRSEEPIAADNDEARRRLGGIADAFLLHDRPIASAYDDSVTRVFEQRPIVLRRARSYAPAPLDLPFEVDRPILAFGAHLKSTFCLLAGRRAYLSQHIGDLENLETLEHFKETLALYERLFGIHPEILAHDLHPEYLSTKLALATAGGATFAADAAPGADPAAHVQCIGVQHHHAHIVSCLAEHGLPGPVIGVAFDGLGYGRDGHLWGGEFLIADRVGFERRAHLREAPMPGGAAAVRKPYRMALGYLAAWFPASFGGRGETTRLSSEGTPSPQPSPRGRGSQAAADSLKSDAFGLLVSGPDAVQLRSGAAG